MQGEATGLGATGAVFGIPGAGGNFEYLQAPVPEYGTPARPENLTFAPENNTSAPAKTLAQAEPVRPATVFAAPAAPVTAALENVRGTARSAKSSARTLRQRIATFLHDAFGENDPHAGKLTLNDLINAESAIGATIFGPVPEGRRREFFHHQNNVWIWYESWTGAAGEPQETTIRYEVRPDGVYKRPLGSSYTKLTGAELANFRAAAHLYLELIKQRLY